MPSIALARATIGALALALAPLPLAQAARETYQLVDCSRLPEGAVTQAPPAPIGQWTRIDCRQPFGQLLVQQPGWHWRYSGTFTQEVVVAAIMGHAAEEGGGARYFRDVSVSTPTSEQLAALDRQLKQDVASYAFITGEEKPRAGYTLRAMNDVLDIITVHFLERAEGQMWAVVCAPKCRPEDVFLVQKVGG
jgi:hypothetical protein